jgi:hypothetical protein
MTKEEQQAEIVARCVAGDSAVVIGDLDTIRTTLRRLLAMEAKAREIAFPRARGTLTPAVVIEAARRILAAGDE